MPNTYATTTAHTLIRKESRKALHAAINVGDGWKTACGETFPVAACYSWTGSDAWEIIDSELDSICARCERVGASLL
jgi:hypothetical protein